LLLTDRYSPFALWESVFGFVNAIVTARAQ
jgi:hypothetical protein